jgi:hypothetical protein
MIANSQNNAVMQRIPGKRRDNDLTTPTGFLSPNTKAWLILMIVACIQYGYGLYISMAMAGFILLLSSSRLQSISSLTAVPLVAFSIAFLWNVALAPPAAEFKWLREIRLTLLLSALIYLQRCIFPSDFKSALTRAPWITLTILLSSFALLQYIGLSFGKGYFVPSYMFVSSDDLALGASWTAHAEENGLVLSIRPSSLYSEPSYFGLILLFLHVLILLHREAKASLAMSLFIILISTIISSGLAIVANITVAVFHHNRNAIPKLIISVAILGVLMLLLSMLGGLPDRLTAFLDGTDASANVRLWQPLTILSRAIAESPFGFPTTGALSYFIYLGDVAPRGEQPFQNGLFNLILSYGVTSPLILAIIFQGGQSALGRIFIFFALVQNGSYSEIDKLVLITIVCCVIPKPETSANPIAVSMRGPSLNNARFRELSRPDQPQTFPQHNNQQR